MEFFSTILLTALLTWLIEQAADASLAWILQKFHPEANIEDIDCTDK